MAGIQAELVQQVDAYFRSQHWKYEYDEEKYVFRLEMNLGNKLKSCRMLIMVGEDHISGYGVSPIAANHEDKEEMALVNEFLARANYGMRQGNFELDYRDGEIRFKSPLFCGIQVPSIDVVERVVDMCFLMFKRYGNGLLAVLFAKAVPAQEIAKIED
jgi:hypothetical protein